MRQNAKDGRLLGKLRAGDAVAQSSSITQHASPHSIARETKIRNMNRLARRCIFPIAFSELVTYTNQAKAACVDNQPLVFKLAHLVTLFQSRVVQLGVGLPDVHTTRLKEKLLFHIPVITCWPTTLIWATS